MRLSAALGHCLLVCVNAAINDAGRSVDGVVHSPGDRVRIELRQPASGFFAAHWGEEQRDAGAHSGAGDKRGPSTAMVIVSVSHTSPAVATGHAIGSQGPDLATPFLARVAIRATALTESNRH